MANLEEKITDIEKKITEFEQRITGIEPLYLELKEASNGSYGGLVGRISYLENTIERFDPEEVLYINELESSPPFRKLRMAVERLNTKTNAKIAELEKDIDNLQIKKEALGYRVPVDMVAKLVNKQGGGGKRRKKYSKKKKKSKSKWGSKSKRKRSKRSRRRR